MAMFVVVVEIPNALFLSICTRFFRISFDTLLLELSSAYPLFVIALQIPQKKFFGSSIAPTQPKIDYLNAQFTNFNSSQKTGSVIATTNILFLPFFSAFCISLSCSTVILFPGVLSVTGLKLTNVCYFKIL